MLGTDTLSTLMIHATFRIQLPADLWVTELSERYPRATFRLLSGYRADQTALELGEVITDTPETVVDAMRAHSSITKYELLESDDRRALGKYESHDTALYDFVEQSSLTIEFPLGVTDGWYEFDLTGTRDELNRLQDVLDSSPLSYELRFLVHTTDTEGLVTRRQREVLAAAIRNGYLEVPRDCTLAALADELDIDPSTASTIYRRGTRNVLRQYLADTQQH